jgi:hypothetical protein
MMIEVPFEIRSESAIDFNDIALTGVGNFSAAWFVASPSGWIIFGYFTSLYPFAIENKLGSPIKRPLSREKESSFASIRVRVTLF